MTAHGSLPINAVKWLLECEARLGQIESSVQMLGKLVSKNTERMTSLLAQMEEMQCHLKSYLEAETSLSIQKTDGFLTTTTGPCMEKDTL